eukprot:gene20514-biopygen6772
MSDFGQGWQGQGDLVLPCRPSPAPISGRDRRDPVDIPQIITRCPVLGCQEVFATGIEACRSRREHPPRDVRVQ